MLDGGVSSCELRAADEKSSCEAGIDGTADVWRVPRRMIWASCCGAMLAVGSRGWQACGGAGLAGKRICGTIAKVKGNIQGDLV